MRREPQLFVNDNITRRQRGKGKERRRKEQLHMENNLLCCVIIGKNKNEKEGDRGKGWYTCWRLTL